MTTAENSSASAIGGPIEALHPADPDLFRADTIGPVFARLRNEDPVHFTPDGAYGPYWSITRFNDIMAVDTNHQAFSSAHGITLESLEKRANHVRPTSSGSFITMDPPAHDVQRKAVSPAVGPANLALLAPQIRERAGIILDGLPIGETFDWVDLVSKELTAMTLATLFGFPFEDRRKLTFWSDVITNEPGDGPVTSWEQRREVLGEVKNVFARMWNERVNSQPTPDLISMLAHGENSRNMSGEDFLGNLGVLIVGGNDTTRNTISGSIVALNRNPDQYQKLRDNPGLIASMISETLRWQTPVAHMRRLATQDIEFGGKTIRQGDSVVMWYVSGNRDHTVIERPNDYIIDRERPRNHLSFGFGVHRCIGNRLAELQLTIIWEEILKRFPVIELAGEPTRTRSVFVHGYETLPVVIPARI